MPEQAADAGKGSNNLVPVWMLDDDDEEGDDDFEGFPSIVLRDDEDRESMERRSKSPKTGTSTSASTSSSFFGSGIRTLNDKNAPFMYANPGAAMNRLGTAPKAWDDKLFAIPYRSPPPAGTSTTSSVSSLVESRNRYPPQSPEQANRPLKKRSLSQHVSTNAETASMSTTELSKESSAGSCSSSSQQPSTKIPNDPTAIRTATAIPDDPIPNSSFTAFVSVSTKSANGAQYLAKDDHSCSGSTMTPHTVFDTRRSASSSSTSTSMPSLSSIPLSSTALPSAETPGRAEESAQPATSGGDSCQESSTNDSSINNSASVTTAERTERYTNSNLSPIGTRYHNIQQPSNASSLFSYSVIMPPPGFVPTEPPPTQEISPPFNPPVSLLPSFFTLGGVQGAGIGFTPPSFQQQLQNHLNPSNDLFRATTATTTDSTAVSGATLLGHSTYTPFGLFQQPSKQQQESSALLSGIQKSPSVNPLGSIFSSTATQVAAPSQQQPPIFDANSPIVVDLEGKPPEQQKKKKKKKKKKAQPQQHDDNSQQQEQQSVSSSATTTAVAVGNTAPKAALHFVYGKPPRRKVVSADHFHSWEDGGPAHSKRYTSIFVCPLSGELFLSVPYPGANASTTTSSLTNYTGRPHWGGLYWFNKKLQAEHAAAVCAHDCIVFRDHYVDNPELGKEHEEGELQEETLQQQQQRISKGVQQQLYQLLMNNNMLISQTVQPYLESEAIYDMPSPFSCSVVVIIPPEIRTAVSAQQEEIERLTGRIVRGKTI